VNARRGRGGGKVQMYWLMYDGANGESHVLRSVLPVRSPQYYESTDGGSNAGTGLASDRRRSLEAGGEPLHVVGAGRRTPIHYSVSHAPYEDRATNERRRTVAGPALIIGKCLT